jgi:Domain of unknown function (DUF4203)
MIFTKAYSIACIVAAVLGASIADHGLERRELAQTQSQTSLAHPASSLDNANYGLLTKRSDELPLDQQTTTTSGQNGTDNGLLSRVNSGFDVLSQLGIVSSILLILVGAVFIGWGHRSFKTLVFMLGFILAAWATLAILYKMESNGTTFGGNKYLIFILVPIAIGIVGGLLLRFFYKVGVIVAGAAGGFVLANYILQFPFTAVYSSNSGSKLTGRKNRNHCYILCRWCNHGALSGEDFAYCRDFSHWLVPVLCRNR